MEGHCDKCGAQQQNGWKFCPHCGVAGQLETARKTEPQEHENAPTQGAYGGLLIGLVAAPILIIPGALMCLTGLGAVLGIPMIVVGVFMPLIGPLMGLGAVKGKCPSCGATVSGREDAGDFLCLECGKRIAISHRHFIAAS